MHKEEEVILVNELDIPQGSMEKLEAHRRALLHRAFSVFIFDGEGNMLLQRRAGHKYHSPGLWTNSCCSHPRPGEDTGAAAQRRLKEELGFSCGLKKAFEFTYKTVFDNGLTEYEFDHVYLGVYDGPIEANPEEVSEWTYWSPEKIRIDLQAHPEKYTSWFHLAFPMLESWKARADK